jgi:hypothetical protein
MINSHRLVIDTFSDVYKFIAHWADDTFWDFQTHEPQPGSVYVIGRKQFTENFEKIRDMIESGNYTVIFDNSAEGSWTLINQLRALRLDQVALDHRLWLISGGDLPEEYQYLHHDHFLVGILDYEENLQAIAQASDIFTKLNKPYKFLFLNGRARPHRKYMWERFKDLNLLDHSLWTMLDSRPTGYKHFTLETNGINRMSTITPLQWLPPQYEFTQFREPKIGPGPPERTFIKNQLFNNLWGEIYLQAEPYIDTYFSLVTETVYEFPYSFRTEKIAKPLAIGHPWICATSTGFYRDIQNLGFKTFGHVIDESFDSIDNHQDRMDRIVAVVNDLCQQDLQAFLQACEPVCKYNQQHLQELVLKIKSEFPERFCHFLKATNA